MNEANTIKLNQLLEDKEFVMTMLGQESPEAVQNLFLSKGVDLTLEEVNELGETFEKCFDKVRVNGELDESLLEDVSGGSITLAAGVSAWAVAKAVIGVGAAGLAIYKWYKSSH